MWETLDEAVRADIDTMPLNDVYGVYLFMGMNMSEDLMDAVEQRFYRVKDTIMPDGCNIVDNGKMRWVAKDTAEYKHAVEHAAHH